MSGETRAGAAAGVGQNPRYEQVRAQLAQRPYRWLVTGAAGFIGSNLVEALLALDQEVPRRGTRVTREGKLTPPRERRLAVSGA